MTEAGLREFAKRDEQSAAYSYEQRRDGLSPEYKDRFKAQPEAWAFFEKQAPWYKRAAGFWVMDAKREETRERRLATLDRRLRRRPPHRPAVEAGPGLTHPLRE